MGHITDYIDLLETPAEEITRAEWEELTSLSGGDKIASDRITDFLERMLPKKDCRPDLAKEILEDAFTARLDHPAKKLSTLEVTFDGKRLRFEGTVRRKWNNGTEIHFYN
jgi:hypothetical protein